MKSIEEQAEEYVNQEKTTLRDLSTIQKIALKSHLIDFAKQAINSKLEEAIKICETSKVDRRNETDNFYNAGLKTAEKAINSLKL